MSISEWWVSAVSHAVKGETGRTALLAALILWQQHRMNRDNQPLKLTGRMRRKFNLNRYQVRRALTALEKAGLITMQRFKHRSPLITLMTGQKDG